LEVDPLEVWKLVGLVVVLEMQEEVLGSGIGLTEACSLHMAKLGIDFAVRSMVGHMDSEAKAAFQLEVEEVLETVVLEAGCIAGVRGREHICSLVEDQREERCKAMLP
jgi:hypothetical protein